MKTVWASTNWVQSRMDVVISYQMPPLRSWPSFSMWNIFLLCIWYKHLRMDIGCHRQIFLVSLSDSHEVAFVAQAITVSEISAYYIFYFEKFYGDGWSQMLPFEGDHQIHKHYTLNFYRFRYINTSIISRWKWMSKWRSTTSIMVLFDYKCVTFCLMPTVIIALYHCLWDFRKYNKMPNILPWKCISRLKGRTMRLVAFDYKSLNVYCWILRILTTRQNR